MKENDDLNRGLPFPARSLISIRVLTGRPHLEAQVRLSGERSSTVQIFVNGAVFPGKAEPDATALQGGQALALGSSLEAGRPDYRVGR